MNRTKSNEKIRKERGGQKNVYTRRKQKEQKINQKEQMRENVQKITKRSD